MRTSDFHYHLPAELIAQYPAVKRDASRLLVLDRSSRSFSHKRFSDFPAFLKKTDLLVVNNSKVLPARLRAEKPSTGGTVEILLVEELKVNEWWAMVRPGKRVRAGSRLVLKNRKQEKTDIFGEVQEKSPEGHYRIRFHCGGDIKDHLGEFGEIPLPPYIERPKGPEPEDSTRYQTVFARPPGSVAAPTAGLHFTPALLDAI